jgi:HAD superfamily hydrolase (TIGR01490 family)
MKLVLFDLDNTLLDGDSDYEWAQFLIEKGVISRQKYERRNKEFLEAYEAGSLDINQFLDFQLKPLSEHSRNQLNDWHDEFMQVKIDPMISNAARQLVLQFKNELIAIVTATNSFITGPIAREFGIKHLIATDLEEQGGEFTGRSVGEPSFKNGKVTRVNAWLNDMGLSFDEFEETLFFSDSINDLPLLEIVQKPVAVNPDPKLLSYAMKNNWDILHLHPRKKQ